MAKLIIFTHAYPYEGDLFLDTELPFLTEVFQEVIVLPLRSRNIKITVSIPDRVSVCEPILGRSRSSFVFRSLFSAPAWTFFFQEFAKTLLRRPYDIRKYVRILFYAMVRAALETHPVVMKAIRSKSAIVAYAYWGNVPALAMPRLSKAGIDCWVRYHRSDLYLYVHKVEYFPFREEIVSASHSIMISEDGKEYFLEHWGSLIANKSEVLVSRLGTLYHGLNPKPGKSRAGEIVIVSCSFLRPEKRVGAVAKLVKELAENRRIVWHHFGGPVDGVQDTNVQAELKNMNSDRLMIKMHGTVPKPKIMSFYKENPVDLFVNLSSSEGLPVSIMEAISFDIPIVATNVGGVREVVVTGRSGMLIELEESENATELAKKILTEMEPGGALSRSRPHELWRELYDAEKNYPNIAKLLNSSLTIPCGADP